MATPTTWLVKMLLSHLLTDFLLQPSAWVAQRKRLHYRSAFLYLHGFLTGCAAWIFMGCQHAVIAMIIFASHTLIDLWKSYQDDDAVHFLADQAMHLAVIVACWAGCFADRKVWMALNGNEAAWKLLLALVFVTVPAGLLIGKLTTRWRKDIEDNSNSLSQAGKWIGFTERIIVVLFVVQNQFSAIGLLVTAKGIIRFNEKDRPEVKTEYLVIGTLLSIGIAIVTGLLARS